MNAPHPKTALPAARRRAPVLREAGIAAALLVLIVAFALLAPQFATFANLRNILNQITINTILAVGLTFVILVGGIDLSVGAVLAFASMVAGLALTHGGFSPALATALAIAAAALVGLASGWLNGAVSERWRLPSFIVTLGMLNIARGAALLTTNARTLYDFPAPFVRFGTSTLFGSFIPLIFMVAVVVMALSAFVLSRTVFGRMVYAIGNNEEAVRLSGHNPSRYKIAVFTLSGLLAGVAGLINMARLTIATPIVGAGFELDAIAAAIIGGTSLSGGKGSILGTFLGACIIGVLQNGLVLVGVGDFLRQMITGGVIVVAVIIDHYRGRLFR
ncbi:ABC transporter permease [Deinococcus oregonensis]|uniref:ABC transporter permease n=1 Tax=Deinococcus oregonensis TaxID=1805970 RepID=A0ABV6AV84_9DEIO